MGVCSCECRSSAKVQKMELTVGPNHEDPSQLSWAVAWMLTSGLVANIYVLGKILALCCCHSSGHQETKPVLEITRFQEGQRWVDRDRNTVNLSYSSGPREYPERQEGMANLVRRRGWRHR